MNYRVLFVYPNLTMTSMVPQSIAILSSVLRENGIETDVFDTTFYETGTQNTNAAKKDAFLVKPFDFSERGIAPKQGDVIQDFKNKVAVFRPDLIALSFVEDTFRLGIQLLESVGENDIPVVAGGPFCTYAADKALRSPEIDYVVRGEGEYPLLELCRNLASGMDIKNIRNLCYRDDGKFIMNPLRLPVDIDELPTADYSIFEENSLYRPMNGRIYRTAAIETQRGCPFSCGYCCSGANNRLHLEHTGKRFFRKKKMARFSAELESLVKAVAPEFIYFLSDVFLLMEDREFDQFCDIYSQYKLPFYMNTRAETVTEERIGRLEELNCIRGNIGIEHGNEEFRTNVIGRKIKNTEIIRAIEITGRSSISTAANNIIGFPTETRELIFDTVNLNRHVAEFCDSVSCFIFAPYHGTPLRILAIEKGYLHPDTLADSNTLVSSLLQMPHLTNDHLRGLQRTFTMYVRFPESRWNEIRIAEQFTPEGDAAFARLSGELRKKFQTG